MKVSGCYSGLAELIEVPDSAFIVDRERGEGKNSERKVQNDANRVAVCASSWTISFLVFRARARLF